MAAPRRLTSTERASLVLLAIVLVVTVAVMALRSPAVAEEADRGEPPATADTLITTPPAKAREAARDSSLRKAGKSRPPAQQPPASPPRRVLEEVKNR